MKGPCGKKAERKILGPYPGAVCLEHYERLRDAIDSGEIRPSGRFEYLSAKENFYESVRCTMLVRLESLKKGVGK